MKILFTGGGSGGHFYPIIAVAEQIEKITREEKLLTPKLYYMAPDPQNERMLFDHEIKFIRVPTGKRRLYFSIQNFLDIFKTIFGVIRATFKMYSIYPDVVFGKGGFGSFPALFAARLLRIPVVIHESDSYPGKVNIWAGKFADRVAVSYKEAAAYFPPKKVAWTGQPIRESVALLEKEEAYKFFKLEPGLPVILVLGGSQGAEAINETVLNALSDLLPNWQIIHQTGAAHLEEILARTSVSITDEKLRARYHPFDFLPDKALALAASVSTFALSRAGSTIFEIAALGLPGIIVPIPKSSGDHQKLNATIYYESGACVLIEQHNFSPHVFVTEADKLRQNETLRQYLAESAKKFHQIDAARKIAQELIRISLEHH